MESIIFFPSSFNAPDSCPAVLVFMALIIFLGAPAWVDSAVSVAIALVIFGAAYRIFREASNELTDHIAVDPREIEAIVRIWW